MSMILDEQVRELEEICIDLIEMSCTIERESYGLLGSDGFSLIIKHGPSGLSWTSGRVPKSTRRFAAMTPRVTMTRVLITLRDFHEKILKITPVKARGKNVALLKTLKNLGLDVKLKKGTVGTPEVGEFVDHGWRGGKSK